MASLSPEHPDFEPEDAAPERPAVEPRLLTRRDPERDQARDESGNGYKGSGPLFGSSAVDSDSVSSRHAHHPLHRTPMLEHVRRRLRSKPHSEVSLQQPTRRKRFGRALRRTILSLVVLLAACAAAVVTIALFLRHDMRAALPQLDGELHVAGLSAPVTVARDPLGVPTIHAETLDDLLFAQGFVTAQDRLWQMDALRRHAAGELAEILGPSMVDHDRQQRILQLRAAADRAILVLPPDQLAQLEAYARGVNAFLDTNADRLPVEFHLLHYKPAPWTPRDSLLVSLAMFQDLGTSFPTKLRRETFAQHLPPELLADLYPTHSFRDQPPTQPRRDLTAPQPEVLQIPLDDSQVKLEMPESTEKPGAPGPDFRTRVFGDQPPTCAECRAGSNNWAVNGQHSASGKPLVSNDMHLGLSVPDIWYEAGLHTTGSPASPTLDVAGFTLPGVPFVIVGRNAHVAWSVTNLGGDVQDLHIEHLRGSGDTTEFQQPDGSWAPVAHHRELIRVRGGHDRVLDVLTTATHIGTQTSLPGHSDDIGARDNAIPTPIISPLYPGEKRAISLLWTPYDPHNLTSPFLAVNAAGSGSALVASFASFGGPSLNLVYADDAGHIGYHAIGRIPIRGPAERHPRVQPAEVVPQNGTPPPDESPEGEPSGTDKPQPDQPQARQMEPTPSLSGVLWASERFDATHYTPATMRHGFGGVPWHPSRALRPSSPLAPPITLNAAHFQPGGYLRHRRPIRIAPSPVKQLPDEPIPPAPVLRDYTIGSPLPAVPIDALDMAAQWSGYIPFEELPAILDPADGVLATANARITPDDYPYFMADDWAPPYRVERIRKLLAGRTGLSPADMLRIQTDTTSAFDRLLGERLVYAIDHASEKALGKEARRLHQAADLLRTWAGGTPGNMTTDSPAAAIVAAVRPQLWSMLLTPQIARHDHLSPTDASLPKLAAQYEWAGQTVALESLLTFQPDRWLPPGFARWNDLLTAAVARSLAEKSAPHDLSHWNYGAMHPVDIEHPVLSMSPLLARLLGTRTGTGAQPIGGDGTTIQATSRAFGPSERFTADLADAAATTGNITTGQSANPGSPHFLDQFDAWLHGATFSMPLVGAPAQHTLRLLP